VHLGQWQKKLFRYEESEFEEVINQCSLLMRLENSAVARGEAGIYRDFDI
jgi:hypothetical protein